MNLIIVESPTKAKTLTRFLADGSSSWQIEATMGHIMDLPKSKLGVDLGNNFKPDYVIVEGKKKVVDLLVRAAKKADNIYLATDPDREGEAIAAHVAELFNSLTVKQLNRIVFHEITKEAVEHAIKTPGKINEDLVDAQIGRRVLDRVVGYKLSPLLWRKVRRGLSAGRVQSVTVRLIVEKEREIEAFKAEEYWEIFCNVKQLNSSTVNQEFTIQLINVGDKKAEIKDKNTADLITDELNKSKYSVLDVKKKEVKKNPYPPFTTSTLTQAGARLYGWSAKRTMQFAQRLYEEGKITYHRTDSLNLSQQAVSAARDYIAKQFGENYLPPSARFYKTTSKVAQEAHEAIRPTEIKDHGQEISDAGQKKLYELIWKRFLACQMSTAIYNETVIEFKATYDIQNSEYILRASGQIMKFDGWTRLRLASARQGDEVILPDVEKDEKLKLIKVDPQQKFTQPPARFNEASLIKTLERLGIGRPSTYAPTINTIQVRNYVEKNEGKFKPTSIGIAVNDFLITNFPALFEYKFTAHMEDSLDEIANGIIKWTEVIREFWDPFSIKLADVEKNAVRVKIETEKLGKACPDCEKARLAGDESRQGELVVRTGRFGRFISCSLFPACKYTEKLVEKTGAICPECKQGDVIIKKSKRGRKFFGCSRYPDCKWASWQKPKEDNSVKSE